MLEKSVLTFMGIGILFALSAQVTNVMARRAADNRSDTLNSIQYIWGTSLAKDQRMVAKHGLYFRIKKQ